MEPPKADPKTNTMDSILRNVIRDFEKEFGTRPRCVLSCQDAADEHWQVWHPGEDKMYFTIDKELEVYRFHD